MKHLLALIVIVLMPLMLCAQHALPGMGDVDKSSLKKAVFQDIKAYQINERYGTADSIAVDTLITNYQDNQPINNYSIANSWNGNLGSPLQSKIFFDRTRSSYNMFASAWEPYLLTPGNMAFYNTMAPFSQLVYRTSTPTYHEEDNLKLLLTFNTNRYFNVGGLYNLIYGRGQYAYQADKLSNGGFWARYSGKQYECAGVVMLNNFMTYENGGLSDITYVTDITSIPGASNYTSSDYPTNLEKAISKYRNNIFYFNQKYSLGFTKERKLKENDSIVYDFVPVTSFIHTMKFERINRVYKEADSITSGFYGNNYYSGEYTNDSSRLYDFKNTFAITLEEAFNKLFKFGLAAFVEYDVRHYENWCDTIEMQKFNKQDLSIGATLSKRQGRVFKYDATAELYMLGERVGNFNIHGNLLGSFRLWNDTVQLTAGAHFVNQSPMDFLKLYYSNHFQWNNQFGNTFTSRIHGRISLPNRGMSLGLNVENISNYIYFNHQALPAQYTNNIQVIAADGMLNLNFWRFHSENKLVYQLTSNDTVLPLPDLALYSNLYFKETLFKVLVVQVGASLRYHTSYYAPEYMPATGQFYTQNQYKLGNYPNLNFYASFFLKRMRFFVEYTNAYQSLFNGTDYFSMPNYPTNPATFHMGLSWTFHK